MDVLEFGFQAEALKNLQQDVKSLSSVNSPLLIVGDAGTGKTTWSHVVCRFDGVAQVIESHEAPKTLKGWKDISLNWDKHPVILENIDKWSDISQSSFLLFFKDNKRSLKRLVSTSSTRLMGKIREGQFRTDLYYSLAVRKIDLPKLADCLVDFEKIVSFWIEVNGLMAGFSKVEVASEAIQKMKTHKWQGNFTELVNILERAMSFSQGNIQAAHIRFDEWDHDNSELEAGLTLAEVERKLIMQTLNLTSQNKSQAARMLGISIRTLRNKLNEYRQEAVHELI